MKFLLDTHTLLWHFAADANLSDVAKNVIINSENEIFVSMASVREFNEGKY